MARKKPKQTHMFPNGEDLPLFSGVAPRGKLSPFDPQPDLQPRMPGLDWKPTMTELYNFRHKIIRPRRRRRR